MWALISTQSFTKTCYVFSVIFRLAGFFINFREFFCKCENWSECFVPSRSLNTAAMPPPGVCLNIIEARHKQDSYGIIDNPDRFFNQDYQELKQYCLIRGVRYIDDMFPPDRSSIGEGLLNPSDVARIVWLRPAVSL